MKNIIYFIFCLMLVFNSAFANTEVQIVSIKGDVKVRYGLNEQWQKAAAGEILKDIDTIFNGEDARSVLKLDDGSLFTLGPNSVLDISDLRIILEKEMFLFLMSKKVSSLENTNGKTELRVGNVSVIHGMDAREMSSADITARQKSWALREIHGAVALYENHYFSNCIVKLHTILSRYDTLANQGMIYLYMGQAFEALEKKGQAIDAYQKLVQILTLGKNQSVENVQLVKQIRLEIKKLSE